MQLPCLPIVACICAFFVCVKSSTTPPSVIAHRGSSGIAPENTMAAFQLAVNQGANGLEADVQVTLDRQLVILHDDTLNRTTNCTGYVSQLTWDEIKYCDASYKFPQYAGARIPLLSEVISLAVSANLFVVLDYKSATLYASILAQYLNSTNQLDQTFRLIGSCWYPNQLADFVQYLPGCPKQFLTSGVNPQMDMFWPRALASGINGFSIGYKNISKDFVTISHSRLLSVVVWTVDDESDMKMMIDYGVDGIITDYPQTLIKIINEKQSPVSPSDVVKTWQVIVIAIGSCLITVVVMVAGFKLCMKQKSYTKLYS